MINSSMFSEQLIEYKQHDRYVIKFNDYFLYSKDELELLCQMKPEHIIPFNMISVNGTKCAVFETMALRPLIDTAYSFSLAQYIKSVKQIFDTCNAMKESKVLSLGKLVMDIGRIFYDPCTGETSMLYLPVSIDPGNDLDNEIPLRSEMIRLAQIIPDIPSTIRDRMCQMLADTGLSLNQIQQRFDGMQAVSDIMKEEEKQLGGTEALTGGEKTEDEPLTDPAVFENGIRLEGTVLGAKRTFNVNQDEFILGKSKQMADGVMEVAIISRRHCVIRRDFGHFYLEDLNSTNGTWLNDQKLIKDSPMLLHEDDRITIANVVLEVRRV